MQTIKVKLEGGVLPSKNNPTDAGYDVYVPEDTYVKPVTTNFGRQVIPLGFKVELPSGYAFSVRPRSGYASKGMEGYEGYDIDFDGNRVFFNFDLFDKVYDSKRYDADVILGLCDCGYRGQYGVIVKNHGKGFWLKKGTRIAQLVLERIDGSELVEADALGESDRGEKGFGSSDD